MNLEIEKLVYSLNDPDKVRRMKEKAEAEKRALEELKEKLAIQEKEINASRIAVAEMASENTDMRGLLGDRKAELGKDKEVLEKKMEQQNKRFKRLMVENEDLRRTLLGEMDKAEDNLKDLEVQFLEMPNPFADEVAELRQGYDDNMKVVTELSKQNFELTEELTSVKQRAATTQDTLEKKLAFTIEMLDKVKTMETFKLIANPDILAALDADGDGDIEMDEALPVFQAQGMSYEEAVALFNRLDISGDGTISAEEFAAFKASL
jgi:chromosome segregation ATPase